MQPANANISHRQILLDILTTIQNAEYFSGQDILQFAGYLDEDELTNYILRHFRKLAVADRARALETAKRHLSH